MYVLNVLVAPPPTRPIVIRDILRNLKLQSVMLVRGESDTYEGRFVLYLSRFLQSAHSKRAKMLFRLPAHLKPEHNHNRRFNMKALWVSQVHVHLQATDLGNATLTDAHMLPIGL